MPGAICLTFDDLFVEHWLSACDLFNRFNARVTFCVSHLHRAKPRQVAGLRSLQADGHEIGYHTRTHPRLKPYLARYGLDHWLHQEIDRGIAEHRAQGFPATSFACPHHASTPETRAACAERFAVIRADGPRGIGPDTATARIYDKPATDRIVHNLGFADAQHRAFPGWDRQIALLDLLAERNGTGVFVGHDIRATRDGPGFYTTRHQLRRLLHAATKRGVAFRTLTEFASLR